MGTKKLNPTLGLWAVLVGSFFLISPIFAVIDILPDFIGYAFICYGVSKFADMEDRLERAAKLFRRMALLGVARLIAIVVTYGMSSPVERPAMQLLCSFVLCVLDVMTLIPAWKHMSEGLLYLATRNDGKAVFDVSYRPNSKARDPRYIEKTLLEKISHATLIFLVAREVLAVLPEFAVLNATEGGADVGLRTTLYEYIGFMRVVCAAAVTIWGIVWLVRFVRFAIHLGKDKAFFAAMREKYTQEVLIKPELFARRGIKRGMVFMCVGFAFALDFFLNDLYVTPICVMPDFLMGLLIGVGLLLIRKYVKGNRWVFAVVTTGVYTAVSATEWVLQFNVFKMSDIAYRFNYFIRDIDLYNRWTYMMAVRVAVGVACMVMMFALIHLLSDVIKRYTGFTVAIEHNPATQMRIKALHKELRTKLWVSFGFGCATAVSSVVYLFAYTQSMQSLWQMWGLVDIVMAVVFAITFIYATMQIFKQIDYKYLLS